MVRDTLLSIMLLISLAYVAIPFIFSQFLFFLLVAFTGWSSGFILCSLTPSLKEKHLRVT